MQRLRRARAQAGALARGEGCADGEEPTGALRDHLAGAGWEPGTSPTEEQCAAAMRGIQRAKHAALRDEKKQAAEEAEQALLGLAEVGVRCAGASCTCCILIAVLAGLLQIYKSWYPWLLPRPVDCNA